MPVYYNTPEGGVAWEVDHNDPWNTWVTSSSTTISSNYVWSSWNTTTATSSGTLKINYNDRVINALDEDEQRRLDESRAKRKLEREEQDRKWAEAEARADELLHELLDDQQWEDWLRVHQFEVTGSEGRKYKILKGVAGNVKQLNDQGQVVASLCIHPRMNTDQGRLPDTDAVIAQLLTLRTDEAEFRRIANITQHHELAA